MLFQREEPFRFQFQRPLTGTIRILQKHHDGDLPKEEVALVLDLSPNGAKFLSTLDLPVKEKRFIIELSFVINEKEVKVLGETKWKKHTGITSYTYGLVGVNDEETKKEIIRELKVYAKRKLAVY